MAYTSADIRNIALVGHSGAGKTTLAEILLHKAGVIGQPGTVERGTTVCDYDPQEKAAQHSLDSAICSMEGYAWRAGGKLVIVVVVGGSGRRRNVRGGWGACRCRCRLLTRRFE